VPVVRRQPPGQTGLTEALGLFEAGALYGGDERAVFVRVGGSEGDIWLDLADSR